MSLDSALVAESPDDAAAIMRAAVTSSIARFEEALPTALGGGFAAVVVITTNWDLLLGEMLRSASSALHGAMEAKSIDEIKLHGETVDWLASSLRTAVAEAPFTRFVAAFGPGVGMAVACLAKVRETIADLLPLALPNSGLPRFSQPVDVLRYHRLVDLAIRGMAPPLERLQDALGLSTAELGEVFGVSRQAIDQWRARGVPPERRAKVANLLAVVDLLDRKLKPGRLPLVARRPAGAFGGRSLLEFAASDEHAELRNKVERAFDWSTAA
ncbi:MAG: hypothetical protein ABSE77_23440 [Acidimicrobiales bacterium]|jgi:hypothetical protein